MRLTMMRSPPRLWIRLLFGAAAGASSVLLPAEAEGQIRPVEVETRCPAAVLTVDSVIAEIEAIAAAPARDRPDRRGQQTWETVRRPFTAAEPCPRFRPDVEPRDAAARLLQHALETESPMVAGQALFGLSFAYGQRPDLGPPPIATLSEALATGRTSRARGTSLELLIRWSTVHPEARAIVMEWARAEVGPPAWPELPWEVLQSVRGSPDAGRLAIAEAITAEPERLRNPRVRWWAVCGPASGQYYHRIPQEGDQDDPCHPVHMPQVLPGG